MPHGFFTPCCPQFQNWFASRGWQPRAHNWPWWHMRAGAKACFWWRRPAAARPWRVSSQPDRSRRRPKRSRKRGCTRFTFRRSRRWRWMWRAIWKRPSAEMELAVTVETRTGDTPLRAASASAQPRPTFCLPRRSNWRCCWPIRKPADVRRSQGRGAGRIACALQFQARRSLALGLARLRKLAPKSSPGRPVGDGGGPEPLQRFLVPQPGRAKHWLSW